MASFAGRRRAAPAWSIDEASTFAALKEFKLLQFLSTDKKALTTARRLGLNFSHSQPQSPISAPAGGGGSASTARPPVAATASVTEAPNARQRRSAARSARRHAARRAQLCSRTMLAILFMVRLRRIVGGTFGMVRLYSMMSLMRPQNLIDLLDIWSPMNPNQIIRREIIIARALASV